MVLADVQTSSHVRTIKQSWLVQSLFSLVQNALNEPPSAWITSGTVRKGGPGQLPVSPREKEELRGTRPRPPSAAPWVLLEYLPLTVLLHLPKFSDVASATLNLGGQI